MKRLYECEKCHEVYENVTGALMCEAQVDEILFKVGDIVTASGGFGWFNGDRRWIANPEVVADWRTVGVRTDRLVNGTPCPNGNSNCFDSCCCMEFYYVVTAIDERCEDGEHRTQYHLFTKAMDGETGYRQGFTYNIHHILPVKVENPPKLDFEDLLGQKADHLL